MKKLFCVLLVMNVVFSTAYAQEEGDIIKNTQQDIAMVAGAGAAGAVLGLSTLSFYDKPSKHVSNIWTGAALGIIAGVVYVVYDNAQRNSEDLISSRPSREFETAERSDWHLAHHSNLTSQSVQIGTQFWQSSF
jgi:hypothetical protein